MPRKARDPSATAASEAPQSPPKIDALTLEAFNTKYKALLALCRSAGGSSSDEDADAAAEGDEDADADAKPARGSPVSKDKRKKATSERDFISIVALNNPEIDFLVKLFGLQDCFSNAILTDPLVSDCLSSSVVSDDLAITLMARLVGKLNAAIDQRDLMTIEADAKATTLAHASEFHCRMVNSNVNMPPILSCQRGASTPHLSTHNVYGSSDTLGLIDQSKFDNSGSFQRILRVAKGDPLVQAMPPDAAKAIRSGAQSALNEIRSRPINQDEPVDRRLRQILLPSSGGYIAASPLPANGIAMFLESAEREYTKIKQDEIAQAIEAAKPAVSAENATTASTTGKTKRGRPKKDQESVVASGAPDQEKKPIFFYRIKFPYGGGNSQNVTLLPGRVILKPLFFSVPRAEFNLLSILRFKHYGWRPILSANIVNAALQCVLAKKDEFNAKAEREPSISEIDRLTSGAFSSFIRAAHRRVVDFAATLGDYNAAQDEDQIVSKRVDRATLTRNLTALDEAIIDENFGNEYRDAMADTLLQALSRKCADRESGISALSGRYASNLIKNAAMKTLEACK